MAFRCDAPLGRGRTCQVLVRSVGERCWRHRPAILPVATAAALPPPDGVGAPPTVATIDDVVAALAGWQLYLARLLVHVASGGEPPSEEWMRLMELFSMNTGRMGRLLRDRRALQGQAADGLLDALARAIDEMRTELGWEGA